MKNFKFRDCQQQAIDKSLQYINGKLKTPGIIVLPTAGGKSHTIAGIAKEYGKPILILQPNVDLLEQNYSKFIDMGGEASLYSASANSKEIGHVTYATLRSITSQAKNFKKLGVELVLVDEAHHSYSPEPTSEFSMFMSELEPKKVIGLTATPFRLKNTMEGAKLAMLNRMRPKYFNHFIHVTQIQEMLDLGYWSNSINEEWYLDEGVLKLNTTGTDFTEDTVKKANEINGTNNKIFVRIKQLVNEGKRKSILVFVDSAENAEKFSKVVNEKIFNGKKLSSFVTSKTTKQKRKQDIQLFKEGKIKVMFNYGVLGTGFDSPLIDCIIFGRATNSLAMFYQIYGRGVRILKGKEDFLFIDYGNNFKRLGNPRELSIEDFPGNGWAVFSGDRLITGVLLGDAVTITKQDILDKKGNVQPSGTFRFGKYQGRAYSDIAQNDPGYISWMLTSGKFDFTNQRKLETDLKAALKQAELSRAS